MKTLGMIGGTSWHATVEYYQLLNSGVSEIIGPDSNPPLILHSINVQVMRRQDKDEIFAKYLDVSKKLQKAGADGIIICANTPHMGFDHVQPKIDIPILHIGEATGMEAKKKGLKKLGLLGTKPTMLGDFIPKVLRDQFTIETIIPDEGDLDQTHDFISNELTQGIFSKEAKAFYLQTIDSLQNKGAEGIILGCTELPILFKGITHELPLLATTDLHVKMAVDFILS